MEPLSSQLNEDFSCVHVHVCFHDMTFLKLPKLTLVWALPSTFSNKLMNFIHVTVVVVQFVLYSVLTMFS